MPIKRLVNTAVVGAGMMGKIFPGNIRRAGGELIAYLGIDGAEAERAAQEINLFPNFIGSFGDYEKVLGRNDVDLVVIATPNFMHDPMAIAAAEAGKHVLIEKPLAVTPEKATSVYDALMKARVAGEIDSQYRHSEVWKQVRKWVQEGTFGNPKYVDMKYVQDWQSDPDTPIGWRPEVAVAGKGKLVPDLGAHLIQTTLHILGGEFTEFDGKTHNTIRTRYRPRKGLKVETFGGGAMPPRSQKPDLYEAMDMLDGSQFSGDDMAEANFVLRTSAGVSVPGHYRLSQVDPGEKNHFTVSLVFEEGRIEWDQEHPNQLYVSGKNGERRVVERGSAPGIAGVPPGHPQGYHDALAMELMKMFQVISDADYGRLDRAALKAYTGKNIGDAVRVVEACSKWLERDLILI
jgi:predicted dehydrogenase